jgi:hypothetical protein
MIVLGYGERKARPGAPSSMRKTTNYGCLGVAMVGLTATVRRETTRSASDAARRRKLDLIEERGLLKLRGESVETRPQTSEITDCP